MKYVLDASVALKWVLTEPDSPKALSVRDDFRTQVCELLVPDIFPVEVAHALTRAERKGLIKPPQAA
jgi:predicted nucleic acid-binding protein